MNEISLHTLLIPFRLYSLKIYLLYTSSAFYQIILIHCDSLWYFIRSHLQIIPIS